ncbi:glycosyltransferase family 4 protein [Lacrimispora sp.]|uniref:glycosyltransferase family 4 protein n=1 Tax=Lacrimispora sp. TaxID=2719234 RepID=UPI0028A76046|nr:glycosyltransferase family 4 protein [Lacrimispora sp.]
MKKVIVFGTGTYYEQRKKYLENVDIIAFLDNDINKQGNLLDGVEIISPKDLNKLSYDYIILMSMYQYDMKKQLLNLSVLSNKILEYTQIGRLDLQYKEYSNKYEIYKNFKKKALLITNNLENSGAPRALAEVGKVLLNANYEVYVVSPITGKLEDFYISLGMHVLIEPDITLANIHFVKWIKNLHLSICFINTIVYHYLINNIQKYNFPIVWWIHENIRLPICHFENYKIEKNSNLTICVVGSLARKVMYEKFQLTNCIELLYGCDDDNKVFSYVKKQDKLTFALIGYIHPIKAQDIFLNAINLLNSTKKSNIEFYIIGRLSDKSLYNEVLEASYNSENIKLIDELAPQEMLDFYQNIDIIVCPSRCDTMPMVVAEGLMNHKVCIVSDNTGYTELITDKISGLICETESILSLSNKMEWIIDNKHLIKKIGDNGRKIYEEYFSMETFEKKINKMIL